jgi:DNA-directed RNA polymerase specialized sigma24 family protein
MKEERMEAGNAGPGSWSSACVPTRARFPARERLRRFVELRSISDGSLGETATRTGPTLDASPLDLALGREAVRRYEVALARLRPRDRAAVLGRIELRWPYEQLAEALGVATKAAARAAVIRAIGRLIEAMSR